jgi:hypothetical protein
MKLQRRALNFSFLKHPRAAHVHSPESHVPAAGFSQSHGRTYLRIRLPKLIFSHCCVPVEHPSPAHWRMWFGGNSTTTENERASTFNGRQSTSRASRRLSRFPQALSDHLRRSEPEPERSNSAFTRERALSRRGSMGVDAFMRASSAVGTSKPVTGKAASLHAGPAGEVVAINNWRSRTSQIVPRMLQMHPAVVIVGGGALYGVLSLTFGLLYFATGAECFDFQTADFKFVETLWLSVHVLSTVGFGSAVPVCATGQMLVLFEAYIGLLFQAIIGAYVVFVFMQSRAKVRFSKNCLTTTNKTIDDPEDVLELNFRLVRESYTQIRDAHIYVQARFTLPPESAPRTDSWEDELAEASVGNTGESGALSGEKREAAARHESEQRRELHIETDQMSSLEYWHVSHRITQSSPLYHIRTQLKKHLHSIDVSLSAYDTAFHTNVRLYVRYAKDEIIPDARFERMENTNYDGSITTIDHAKLDHFTRDIAAKTRKSSRGRNHFMRRRSLTGDSLGGAAGMISFSLKRRPCVENLDPTKAGGTRIRFRVTRRESSAAEADEEEARAAAGRRPRTNSLTNGLRGAVGRKNRQSSLPNTPQDAEAAEGRVPRPRHSSMPSTPQMAAMGAEMAAKTHEAQPHLPQIELANGGPSNGAASPTPGTKELRLPPLAVDAKPPLPTPAAEESASSRLFQA